VTGAAPGNLDLALGRLRIMFLRTVCLFVVACGVAAPAARADDWFPHPANARWTYVWSDGDYNPQGTIETVNVTSPDAECGGWQLEWSGTIEVPRGSSGSSSGIGPATPQPDDGEMCFEDQDYGLVNTDWSGDAPPVNEPPLCASSGSVCPNSLGSVLYDVIWGSRNPTISEPLLQGTSWTATGGGAGNVTSQNQYLGLRKVTVPAFPEGIVTAAVRSEIVLAGTPGDDYGSGTRTTYWGYGVGPVKVVFDHVDGSVTNAELTATNQVAKQPRPDADYFPMTVGLEGTYKWSNTKYLKQPEVEQLDVAASASRSARITARSISGPMRVAGDYVFSLRLDGLRNTYGSTEAATLVKFPKLGHGRHFFTPVDLMTYGFNPVLPAYPVPGTTWHSGNPRDTQVFGVKGTTTVIGVRTVRVPAGKFSALEVRSTLTQKGFRFGSGTRTMWFAPNRGLVKLVFDHRDGSVSTVQLIKK
jgi:hypothetical protein